VIVISLVLLLFLPLPVLAAPSCPNEPPGSTRLLNVDYATKPSTGTIQGVTGFNVFSTPAVVTPPTPPGADPASPALALDSYITPTSNNGSQFGYTAPSAAVINKFYSCLYVATNSNFSGNGTNFTNKLYFHKSTGAGGYVTNNGVMFLQKSPNTPGGSGALVWSFNTSGPQFNSPGNYFANVGSGVFTLGVWHVIEQLTTSGTCETCPNARIEAWLDGNKFLDLQNVRYGSGNINQWQWTETWSGSGTALGFQAESHWYLGHLVLSNATGTPANPGELQPPLDNPPGPPGTVTGVTVTVQ
jgi:hypothetical protein